MAPRLSGQTSIFGVVFFVSKSLLGIERQKNLEKFAILTRKPRSHAWILIYRTWPIGYHIFQVHFFICKKKLVFLILTFSKLAQSIHYRSQVRSTPQYFSKDRIITCHEISKCNCDMPLHNLVL